MVKTIIIIVLSIFFILNSIAIPYLIHILHKKHKECIELKFEILELKDEISDLKGEWIIEEEDIEEPEYILIKNIE